MRHRERTHERADLRDTSLEDDCNDVVESGIAVVLDRRLPDSHHMGVLRSRTRAAPFVRARSTVATGTIAYSDSRASALSLQHRDDASESGLLFVGAAMLEWLLMLVVCLGPVVGITRAYASGPATTRRLADAGAIGGTIAGVLTLVVLLAVIPPYAMSLGLFLLPVALGVIGLAMGAATWSVSQLLRRAGL